MNNKKEKKNLKLEEYPKIKFSMFQNVRMNINVVKLFIIMIALNIIIFYINFKKNKIRDDIDFNYATYENKMITKEIIENSGWLLTQNEPYFLNGLIRKFKPKNCLEIGVARGGSSILILNAIKDIPNSILISLDINQSKKIGYRVNQYFPELSKNWKLFKGQQPHKFLTKLNMKFDFVFLDTAHKAPGEIINFIELLPFLNENAIFVLHDFVTFCI